jgi:predicted RNA binding protein YcfA (HicA-like mRNA interferase family)
MSKLPQLKGKKLISILKRAGFEVIRIRGSQASTLALGCI